MAQHDHPASVGFDGELGDVMRQMGAYRLPTE
jgi:hypothetical protein